MNEVIQTTLRSTVAKKLAVATAATLAFVEAANAAVPAEVTTAMADMNTDALKIAAVVLVAVIGVFAFKFMRKGL